MTFVAPKCVDAANLDSKADVEALAVSEAISEFVESQNFSFIVGARVRDRFAQVYD